VPDDTEKGDLICVFDGGEVPYLLRPAGNDSYILIGECYLHGIMDGEAMADPQLYGSGD
jgi:hypothetical protein